MTKRAPRTNTLEVRLSDADLDHVQSQAVANGLSVSDYVRVRLGLLLRYRRSQPPTQPAPNRPPASPAVNPELTPIPVTIDGQPAPHMDRDLLLLQAHITFRQHSSVQFTPDQITEALEQGGSGWLVDKLNDEPDPQPEPDPAPQPAPEISLASFFPR